MSYGIDYVEEIIVKIIIQPVHSYVIGVSNILDANYISNSLAETFKIVDGKVEGLALNEWTLFFEFILNGGIDDIRVYLRNKSNPVLKEKWVTIHLPIPSVYRVDWGVDLQNIIFLKESKDAKKWYESILCDFNFENLKTHCNTAAQAGITYALTTGVTVMGKKIRVPLRE
ncbi:Imm9 family immunity protein [Hymenobacter pini]|uniref:Imm9 family immunity protein n=1 Tax=Hymenobacter pini TaxID=2880879 RepID=UPI001CF3F1A6|nr:Imm9 family immunity protein [Hymenobacter pini]MCA8832661.1 immunity 9 family protein [Hymenobacter pini]